ncbi:MAG: tetratricopeptide repeat protein [Betaproteobacteria bacterium]|nr:tetratricopeptide repeat protein [Betaproteobacteria bacterium]
MPRLAAVLLTLLCATVSLAQPGAYANREQALKDLSASDAAQRAVAVTWIANHGTQADAEALARRLSDESPIVRGIAEQGLWVLWTRSGDKAIDALMAKAAEQMQEQRFNEAIATLSEVIRRRPAFAEGWNRRATVLYLAGEYEKSLADCDEVMKRNQQHFGALAGYGQIYFQLERYDKAIAYWRRALEVNPNMTGVEINIKGAEQLLAEKRRRAI